MKSKSIYIASSQPEGGSLTIAIGFMDMLLGNYKRVAFFRPIIPDKSKDENDIYFMLKHFNLDMNYKQCYGFKVSEYIQAYADDNQDKIYQELIAKLDKLKESYDFVLIEGSSRYQFDTVFDFDINLRIARNLETVYIPILNAKDKSADEIISETHIVAEAIHDEGCVHLATFINRCDDTIIDYLQTHLQNKENEQIYLLPENIELDTPSLSQVRDEFNAKMVVGKRSQLEHPVTNIKVATMSVENYLANIANGDIVIVAGDRIDIIAASIISFYAKNHPNISALLLTGDIPISDDIKGLLEDFNDIVVPILSVNCDSFKLAVALSKMKAKITPKSIQKITLAKSIFDKSINKERLSERFANSPNNIVTPIMFQYRILERARANRQRIILPESNDERILRAVDILIRRDVVDIILLGDRVVIEHQARQLGLNVSDASIINPKDPVLLEQFSNIFYEMRKHKGINKEMALESMELVNYFATMMVYKGMADGMVSGANHTTADTVRPAFEIIKTTPNTKLVSSLFFMCLDTKVLIYADCAINQDPNARELAHIALSSAETAKSFDITPRIAMLSYSTGESGTGPDVQKVREATQIARELDSKLLIDGPIQYDAAIDTKVAAQKLPQSQIAGDATILIFPDLNTGNNTYKAVQRSTGALAIGPILQGLNSPINDLSRGCLVDDIVNTVAITAIQAQQFNGE